MNVKYKYIFKIFKVSNWTIRSPGSIIWNFQRWTILLGSFCVVCLSSFPPLWFLWFPPAVSKRPWFCLISSSLVLDSSSWLLLPLVSSTSELRCWFHDFWDLRGLKTFVAIVFPWHWTQHYTFSLLSTMANSPPPPSGYFYLQLYQIPQVFVSISFQSQITPRSPASNMG